jgi:hypothetical protein
MSERVSIRAVPQPEAGNCGTLLHYDGAHNHPVNRALHWIAIPLIFFRHCGVVSLGHCAVVDSNSVCAGVAGAFDRRD